MKRTILIMQVLVLAALYFFQEVSTETLRAYRQTSDYGEFFYKLTEIKELGIIIFICLVIWFLANLFKRKFGPTFLIWYFIFNLLPATLIMIKAGNYLSKINKELVNVEVIEEGNKKTILKYKNETLLSRKTILINNSISYEVLYYKNGKKEYAFSIDNQQDTLWYPSGQIKLIATSHDFTTNNNYHNLTNPKLLFELLEFHPVRFIAYWNEEGEQLFKDGTGKVMLYHPNGVLAYEHYFTNYATTTINTFYADGAKNTIVKYDLLDFSDFVCEAYQFENLYTNNITWGATIEKFSKSGTKIQDDYTNVDLVTLPISGTGIIRIKYQDGTLNREIVMKDGDTQKLITYYLDVNPKIQRIIHFNVKNKFRNMAVSTDKIQTSFSNDLEEIRQIESWLSVQENYTIEEKLSSIQYTTGNGTIYTEDFEL